MARTFGAALRGVDGIPVEVEVRISSQLPRIDVVGLPQHTQNIVTMTQIPIPSLAGQQCGDHVPVH